MVFEKDLLDALGHQNELLTLIAERLDKINSTQASQGAQLEQIRYSVAVEMQSEIYRKITSNQLSLLETLEKVSSNKMSMARFGDGELGLTAHENRNIAFQRGSYALSKKLRNVLQEQRDGLLVCLPTTVIDPFWMTSLARYWGILSDLIPYGRRWGVSMVSRSYAFKVEGNELIRAWRKCWEGRNVTVVTGKGSRFDAIPELFSGVSSIDYVWGQPKHAFEHLSTLKADLLARELDLVLISLGPAGTVLAAELHDLGIQALDIGHLSNSYQEAFSGGPKPETLPVVRT